MPTVAAPDYLLALRFALRELRGGLRGFGVFLVCIALGVATIAGVGSVAGGMTDGIAREGRVILGGDVALTLVQHRAESDLRAHLDRLGEISEVAILRAMARRTDGTDQALVEVKAIDPAYPLFGTVAVEGDGEGKSLLAERDGAFGGLADPELFTRLGLKIGDTIKVGAATIALRGAIADEPDRLAVGFALGPRVMIDQSALDATGLIQPGSLINWHYRLALPGEPTKAVVATTADAIELAFPHSGFEARTRDDAAPGLRRTIDRFAQFLTLVGLAALIVGGVGVANAVSSYLEGKRDVIATLKCLGAPAGFTVAVYVAQIVILALVGIAIGLAVGVVIPFVAGIFLEPVIPVAIAGVYPGELLAAAVYGLLTALAFALFPLGRAREVSPTALFRDQVAPARAWPRATYLVAVGVAVLALAALAIGLAADRRIAVVFVVAAAAAFVLLRFVAGMIMAAARRLPRVRSTELRLAIGNIHRPGALTPSVVLSLGLGLALLVALVLIDGNFRRELFGSIPADAPSFFFLDIRNPDLEAFKSFVAAEAPGSRLDIAPMMRGRLVGLNGVPADKADVDSDVRWVFEGDRGITYAAMQPAKSKLVEGAWWPKDYEGKPLVSFEAEIGEGLGLKIGDTITVNVLGREVTATVANFREIVWQSLGINFLMVFSPNTFRGAPFASMATLAFPDGGSSGEDLAFLKKVTAAFPAVTAVRVKEVVETVESLTGQIGWAVRAASGVTLLASVLVLGGAFAAGRRRRIHDAVVLKTLGATRARLISAFALEFLMLGLATALFGLVAGALAAWFVLTQVMDMEFAFLPAQALGAAALALLVTLAFGLAGTWRLLGQKAAPVLRNL